MDFTVRSTVGKPVQRIDAVEKAAGKVKYTSDYSAPGMLHAKLVTSTEAHALLKAVDTKEAWRVPGVRAIVTGQMFPFHIGPILADRPPLAFEKVRYYGEPVAIVVADHEYQAKQAAEKVKVAYTPLPVVNSVRRAFQTDAPLIHEKSGGYTKIIDNVYPVPGTNIGSHIKIRKGDFGAAWKMCAETISETYSFNLSDHAALETRNARVEINPAGKVIVHSSTQSPYTIKKVLNQFFNIDVGDVVVHIPMVGGAFGGKGTVQLEPLAYLASKAVGGKLVKLEFDREEDMRTGPCRIGFDATVKLGVDRDGKILAGQYTFLIDSGAYTDQAAGITRAAALDCTGPYHVPNVWCDSYCMYTNHPFATSLMDKETGFGKPGPWWSVGAQAVEVEFDRHDFTYKILKAVTVLDGGTIINPMTAAQQMRGGMYMGLSYAAIEKFIFNEQGVVQNDDFRNYGTLRYGEQPAAYVVDFIESPAADGPYGARGIGEYGVIGAPAALANSLSSAAQAELDLLPLVPEYIWEMTKGTGR